ncbi:hypothetical protein RJ641_007790 [Dillenia turbinata]|uniref:Uncharacterized protein n=1 Tax=Dillenia turbinata TaxID=194707 RepID=A0AAN8Z5W7_9MAGN
MFVWLPLLLDSTVDVTTISFVGALVLLSSLSLFFIFQLRFRSKFSPKLQHFNSLWATRLLLVLFIFLWSLSHLLRLPSVFTSLSLSFSSQVYFCKFHTVLSLGLFQPAFLVILLYLVIVSIRKPNSNNSLSAVSLVFLVFPVVLLQSFFLFSWDGDLLPDIFVRSWSVGDDSEESVVSCTYPLISTVIFGGFAMTYVVGFMVSSYRVVSLVINKGLRIRIYFLTFVVLFFLVAETVCLGFSAAWRLETLNTGLISLLAFLSALLVAAAGESILVIRPIRDSLAATGGFSSRQGDHSSDQVVEV